MKVWGYSAEKYSGIPSPFDIVTILFIIGLPFIHKFIPFDVGDNIYFVFGAIFIMSFSMLCRQVRSIRSGPLGLLLMLGIINVFIHNFRVGEFSSDWINFCLLSEGFIYLFFGIFLITTIVNYSISYKLYYYALIVPIMFTYFLTFDEYLGWSMTPILSLLIAVFFVCLKRYKLTFVTLGVIISVIIYKFDWLLYKFALRPIMWGVTWKDIVKHNFLGRGFDTTLKGWQGLVFSELDGSSPLAGWAYVNNDYLEFMRSYGIIGLGLVLWVLGGLVFGRKGVAWFLGVWFLVMCFFQRTVFFPLKGAIVTVIIALMMLENGMAATFSPKAGGIR